MYITYCDSVYKPSNMVWIELVEFLTAIADCRFKAIVDAAKGNSWKKRNLPAVAFGTFEKSVANANLLTHSGFFHFDIDGVAGNEVRGTVQNLPYVYATWLSPNGGLKGLCSIPAVKNDAEYKLYFKAIEGDFSSLGVMIDGSCKDVRRFCFVSYDANLWINKDSQTYPLLKSEQREEGLIDFKALFKSDLSGVQSFLSLHNDKVKDRLNVILHNTSLGGFHAMRYKAGVIIGGLISGGQGSDDLIKVFMKWNSVIHSTFGDSESIIKKEMKTFYDGLSVGKGQPIKYNFLNSKE